jgi:hypothetical protein
LNDGAVRDEAFLEQLQVTGRLDAWTELAEARVEAANTEEIL